MRRLLRIMTTLPLLALPVVGWSAEADSLSLDEVVVTGTRAKADARFLPTQVDVIGRATLTENHQTSILPTLMQQIPGMMVTSRSMLGYGVSTGAAGNISVRGLAGGAGQLLVLVDGHPQYSGIYGHPFADSYQTLLADHVEVVRGPSSLLYGSNAMGGVVNIITRKLRQDGNQLSFEAGAGSYGTVQVEAADQLRAGRFSMTVAGQYAQSDNHRPHMGFQQYGGLVKTQYDINDQWDLYADLNLTHFISRYPGSTDSPVYGAAQWITRGAATVALENHYDWGQGELSLFTDFGRHKIDDGSSNADQPSQRYFRSRDNIMGVSWWQSVRWIRGGQVTLGVDYQHLYGRASYTSKATGETLDTPNKQSGHSHRNDVAGYVDVRQDLGSMLTLDAGVRVDHHSVAGTEWIPQFGVLFRPSRAGELRGTISKGFRNPTMRELYLYPTSTEDLKAERVWNYELSWTGRLADNRLTYGATLFYIKGDNMIQVINRKNVNTGEVENSGAELSLAWRLNDHWRLNTNHSVLHMVHHVVGAPEYKGFGGVDFLQGRWSANAGLMVVSGLFTTVGANDHKENFTLLNATVNYQATRNLKLWVRGDNLLAQHYEINAGYPMPRATFMGGVNIQL